jgi:exonuclease III
VTLRLLSYNIWHGGQDRLPVILDVIREQRPDLVALQEANSRPNAEALADALGMQLAYGEANGPFAVAWLSRLPILSSQNHRLPILAKTLLEIEVGWNGAPLHLFATHLVAGRTEQDGARRAYEACAIVDEIRRQQGASAGPHVLVGDFNALHPEDASADPPGGAPTEFLARRPIEHVLAAGYIDAFRCLHPTSRATPMRHRTRGCASTTRSHRLGSGEACAPARLSGRQRRPTPRTICLSALTWSKRVGLDSAAVRRDAHAAGGLHNLVLADAWPARRPALDRGGLDRLVWRRRVGTRSRPVT